MYVAADNCAVTIVKSIKDVLLRMKLELNKCRGQPQQDLGPEI